MTAVGPCFKRGQCKLAEGANDAHCECSNLDNKPVWQGTNIANPAPEKCMYAGAACEVACPMFKGKVCGGHGHRNPMHPFAKRAIKHFEGCLWETANQEDILTHYTDDHSPYGGPHGVDTNCGVAKKALCECDTEGGFHGAEESCRVECPGAGWPDGAYGGGRNVCGGGLKLTKAMANSNKPAPLDGGWKMNDDTDFTYYHSRGFCHVNFQLGSQQMVNVKHGLCDCNADWKGSQLDNNILGKFEVKLYKDTCSYGEQVKLRTKDNSPTSINFFRDGYSCDFEGKYTDTITLNEGGQGVAPNCCPFGGEPGKGDTTGGHGSFFVGDQSQCLTVRPPDPPPSNVTEPHPADIPKDDGSNGSRRLDSMLGSSGPSLTVASKPIQSQFVTPLEVEKYSSETLNDL